MTIWEVKIIQFLKILTEGLSINRRHLLRTFNQSHVHFVSFQLELLLLILLQLHIKWESRGMPVSLFLSVALSDKL